MRTLIVGIGALGGLIAARLRAAGSPVWLATRNAESAARLKASGLRVTGVGGAVSVETVEVAPLDEYLTGSRFDLIVLATKAHDAIEVASKLSGLLGPGGTLLPIQNGGVPQMLGDRLGECVLGGLSNLGATMTEPGIYEQRNAGHLLIGELAGGASAGGASSSMAWPRGGAKGHAKSSRGCLVEAAAELLGYHPRGSRGRDDARVHHLVRGSRGLRASL